MGFKLSDLSPLAGIATGKGMMGNLARSGALGLGSMAIAKDAYSDEEAAKRAKVAQAQQAQQAAQQAAQQQAYQQALQRNQATQIQSAVAEGMQGMRKGGYVAKADGIAKRGKTRGKMV